MEATVRRISSLLMSVALVASGVVLTTSVASAAPGDVTQNTSAVIAPSVIAGATPTRLVRLPLLVRITIYGRSRTISLLMQHLVQSILVTNLPTQHQRNRIVFLQAHLPTVEMQQS